MKVLFETEEAWMTEFDVVQHMRGHFLVVKKNEHWSCNAKMYKTKSGAKRGARAEYNKIHKNFEKFLLK